VIKAGHSALLETASLETASRSAFGRLGILHIDRSLAPANHCVQYCCTLPISDIVADVHAKCLLANRRSV
jgi:hypothetical protein